jgi:hypothetical protein
MSIFGPWYSCLSYAEHLYGRAVSARNRVIVHHIQKKPPTDVAKLLLARLSGFKLLRTASASKYGALTVQ